jgi:hypothetical protein
VAKTTLQMACIKPPAGVSRANRPVNLCSVPIRDEPSRPEIPVRCSPKPTNHNPTRERGTPPTPRRPHPGRGCSASVRCHPPSRFAQIFQFPIVNLTFSISSLDPAFPVRWSSKTVVPATTRHASEDKPHPPRRSIRGGEDLRGVGWRYRGPPVNIWTFAGNLLENAPAGASRESSSLKR